MLIENFKREYLFNDLVEYSGMSPDFVQHRIRYSKIELAFIWKEMMDKGRSVNEFYRIESSLYIYDLTFYQDLLFNHTIEMMKQIKDIYPTIPPGILEFGAGIGQFSLMAALLKYKGERILPTYYEISNITKNYALWRFDKYKIIYKLPETDDPIDEKDWDFVNIMDVIEHIPIKEAEIILNKLSNKAKYLFCNIDIPYNEIYPQHITKFNPIDYGFENVHRYLWKNKNK